MVFSVKDNILMIEYESTSFDSIKFNRWCLCKIDPKILWVLLVFNQRLENVKQAVHFIGFGVTGDDNECAPWFVEV